MIVNPITAEGAGQILERRTVPPGLARAPGQRGVDGKLSEKGVSEEGSSEEATGVAFADQLSKGLGGRVVTPEWQQKIGLSHGIQVADQAMEEIDQELQQAKKDLIEIRKMFPPYPHGSEERAELLNSYKSLRLQVDQLTFPPEVESLLEGGLEQIKLSGPVEEVEDSELPALIADLERVSGVLYERRVSLELSAGKIFNQETGEDVVFSKLSVEVQEQLAAYDFSMGRPKTGVHQDLPFLD
ncbi:MAG: hypothetical protein U9Q58_07895 [Pseudomonadota bacterium]|nr:hypothetical protein [Pseudomonadota bacterium]